MTTQFASNSLLQNVDQSTASDGGLALFGYYNSNPAPYDHGDVGSFSVGDNIPKGEIANVGSNNGFLPISSGKGSVFSRSALNTANFYILILDVSPKSIPTKTVSTNIF